MSVMWHKVWSDLWDNKVRTLLATLSIAVGVFALGAIFGMMGQLTPELNRVHRAIVPAHSRIILAKSVDQTTIDRLESIDGVAGIEGTNQLSIRYRLTTDDAWQPGVLIMRADYDEQRYNLLQLKAGDWPRRNNIGLDIRSAQYLNLEFGDKVIFELDGCDRALALSGKIRYHFVTSPDFGDDPHFFIDARGLERFNIPNGQFNQLLVRVDPYSEALAREAASEIKERLGKVGIGVAGTVHYDPDEHWGQQFFDGVYVVLQLLAGVSLVMSVVLIFNTLTALIAQQTDQIGVMKAVGGRTGTIIKVYLAGVLVYGTLALIVSLPLGSLLAFSASRYFLDIFNIDYDVFQCSTQALIIQAVAAIAVPLLAGLWPVLSGARITVRQAIASYGLGGNFGNNVLDRWVERLGARFFSGPAAMALGNMVRRKGRLVLTQLVLTTAGTLFLMVMTLSSSISLTVDNDLGRRGYQTRLSFEDNQRIDHLVKLAESLDEVRQAEVWFSSSVALLRAGQRTREAGIGARLIGIPAGSEMYRPKIVAGRWLQPADGADRAARVIVINEETAEDNHIRLGETVTLDLGHLGDHTWQVVGFYRMLSVGYSPDDIYAPQKTIFRTTPKHNVGRELLIRTRSDDVAQVEAVTDRLKALFEQRNWDIRESQTIHEDRHFFDNFFAEYLAMLSVPAMIMAAVGGIGLMGSLSISVVERTKEIGVLRAIGAKTPVIMEMFIMEGVLQGLISWVIAAPLSYILGQPMAALMGQAVFRMDLDYQYNLTALLIWLATVLFISTLASVLPACNATAISVRASLAYA